MYRETDRIMATSSSSGSAGSAGSAEYVLRSSQDTNWRIYHQPKDGGRECDVRDILAHYYDRESASTVKRSRSSSHTTLHLEKSLPYHHCLMSASLASTRKLVARDNRYYPYPYSHNNPNPLRTPAAALHHIAHIHDTKNITPFVCMTVEQKNRLVCQSAMAGLLVSRLFGISSARPYTIKFLNKHADVTAMCIHSALASEYLIGNRYYYNLPAELSDEAHVVGKLYADVCAHDVTYDEIQESRSQLTRLYRSNIDRLENAVQQFRRGFISLKTMREDPEFTKMFEMFWLVQTQSVSQYKSVDCQVLCQGNGIDFDQRSIDMHVCSTVFSCQVVCPRLFCYDIAHLFDNRNQSYVRYIKMAKAKQLQLSNQGLNSAFLAFSAIEPIMVSMKLAPHIEEKKTWFPSDCSFYMNHIPSRDEIFGSLLCKHRFHIPQTVTIERTYFLTKNNTDSFYLPVQDVLKELRTGKKSSEKIWKKNKLNHL